MNSENLGTRIVENEAWNQKIWALEAFWGGNGLFRRFWSNSEILGVVGGSWRKRQGLLQILGIFRDFLCKIVGIYQILDIFFNGKTR
jgi:hypothetical protein